MVREGPQPLPKSLVSKIARSENDSESSKESSKKRDRILEASFGMLKEFWGTGLLVSTPFLKNEFDIRGTGYEVRGMMVRGYDGTRVQGYEGTFGFCCAACVV